MNTLSVTATDRWNNPAMPGADHQGERRRGRSALSSRERDVARPAGAIPHLVGGGTAGGGGRSQSDPSRPGPAARRGRPAGHGGRRRLHRALLYRPEPAQAVRHRTGDRGRGRGARFRRHARQMSPTASRPARDASPSSAPASSTTTPSRRSPTTRRTCCSRTCSDPMSRTRTTVRSRPTATRATSTTTRSRAIISTRASTATRAASYGASSGPTMARPTATAATICSSTAPSSNARAGPASWDSPRTTISPYARQQFNPTGLSIAGQILHSDIVVGSDVVTLVVLDKRTGAVLSQMRSCATSTTRSTTRPASCASSISRCHTTIGSTRRSSWCNTSTAAQTCTPRRPAATRACCSTARGRCVSTSATSTIPQATRTSRSSSRACKGRRTPAREHRAHRHERPRVRRHRRAERERRRGPRDVHAGLGFEFVSASTS